jgi:hypothetical protein
MAAEVTNWVKVVTFALWNHFSDYSLLDGYLYLQQFASWLEESGLDQQSEWHTWLSPWTPPAHAISLARLPNLS